MAPSGLTVALRRLDAAGLALWSDGAGLQAEMMGFLR